MKKSIVAISVATFLVAGLMIAGIASAQPWGDRPGAGRFGDCPFYLGGPGDDALKLTDDQAKKLIALQENYADKNDDITDAIIKNQRELRKLYTADKPNIAAIDKVQDQMRTLMDKRFALAREFRNGARAILTTEQLTANPYAFMGPGFGRGGGFDKGYGRGMMGGGYGPGCGRW